MKPDVKYEERIERIKSWLTDLLLDLEEGTIYIEDLDQELIELLYQVILDEQIIPLPPLEVLVHVSKETWEEKREKEPENHIHPCDNWYYEKCMCKGACSCHWKQQLGAHNE